jgi:hypothetical protein
MPHENDMARASLIFSGTLTTAVCDVINRNKKISALQGGMPELIGGVLITTEDHATWLGTV